MLTIYRRHKKSCAHREVGRKYRRCRCPIWVDGTLQGKEMRETLGELDWEKAQQFVRDRELTGEPAKMSAMSIADAAAKYIADVEARQLSGDTIKKYKRLFKRLENFAAGKGIKFVDEVDLDLVADFRASWKLGPRTGAKELERLKAFFQLREGARMVEEKSGKRIEGAENETPADSALHAARND